MSTRPFSPVLFVLLLGVVTAALAIMVAVASPAAALACTEGPGVVVFDGGGSPPTSLTDPDNWVGDALPGPADEACVPSAFAGGPPMQMSGGTLTVDHLRSSASLTISGGTLEVADGDGFTAETSVVEGDVVVTGGEAIFGSGNSTNDSLHIEGSLTVSDGRIRLVQGGRIAGDLVQSGGTVSGHDVVDVEGDFTWTGGAQGEFGDTATVGPGRLVVGTNGGACDAASATWDDGPNAKELRWHMTLNVDVSWPGAQDLAFGDASASGTNASVGLVANCLLDITGGADMVRARTADHTNAVTVDRLRIAPTGPDTTTVWGVRLITRQDVDLVGTTLSLRQAADDHTIRLVGRWDVDATSTLHIDTGGGTNGFDDLNVAGTLDVDSGRVRLRGGASTGTITLDIGSQGLILDGPYTMQPGSTLTGAAEVEVNTGGDLTVRGDLELDANLQMWSTAHVDLTDRDVTIVQVEQLSVNSTLTGSGTWTVERFEWHGGTHSGDGGADAVTVLTGDSSGGIGDWEFGGTHVLDGRRIEVHGTVILRNGLAMEVTADAELVVASDGTVVADRNSDQHISGDGAVRLLPASTPPVTAQPGRLVVNARDTTKLLQVDPAVVNGGDIVVNGGVLHLAGPLTTTGSIETVSSIYDATLVVDADVTLDGGSFTMTDPEGSVDTTAAGPPRTWTLTNGATFGGVGTFVGNLVVADGTVVPGVSPGILAITGDWTHNAGTLVVELDGPSPTGPVEFDQVQVSGDVTISGGDIAVDLGYTPAGAQTWDVVTAGGTFTGGFTTVTDLDTGDAHSFAGGVNGSAYQLQVGDPVDLSLGMSMPASAAVGQTVPVTVEVTNPTPATDATNVEVELTLPSGLVHDNGCTHSAGTVTCSIPTATAASATTTAFTVDVVSAGNHTVTGVITALDQADANPGNDSADATVSVPAEVADVSVTSAVSSDHALVGDTVTQTLTVANHGPDPATGTVLDVVVPPELTHVSGCGAPVSGTLSCALGTVASGASTDVAITWSVDSPGTPTPTGTVSADPTDHVPGNDSAGSTITAPPQADLHVTVDVDDVSPTLGQLLTWSVAVRNDGPHPASGSEVQVTLPAGVSYDGDDGGCTGPVGGVLTCPLGPIGPGIAGQQVVQVQTTTTATGAHTASATATTQADDPSSANDTDGATATVDPVADLEVTLDVDTAVPTPGQDVVVTAQVANDGPDTATGGVLSLTLDSDLTHVSDDGGCTPAGSTLTCPLSDLAPGADTTVAVTATVRSDGTRSVGAMAGADQADPDGATTALAFTAFTPPSGGGGASGGAGAGVAGQVTVSVLDAEVEEGDDGMTTLLVAVVLSQAVDHDVEVGLQISEVTTSEGRDYTVAASFTQLATTLTVKAGETVETTTVTIVGDDTAEPDEEIAVELTSVSPDTVEIGDGSATITIVDDDTVPDLEQVQPTSFDDTCLVDTSGLGLPKAEPLTNGQIAGGVWDCAAAAAADTLLIARDDNFADALASGVLQGHAPLMLVPSNGPLPDDVARRLADTDPTRVVILGGEQAVGADVEQQVSALGIEVTRRQGPTRLETAVEVARTDAPEATTAIIARAFPSPDAGDPTQAFADAIAAGGMAAEMGYPVLLTQTEALSPATADYLAESSISDVLVMGGTAAVSEDVVAQLRDMVPGTVERIAAPSRFGTAVEVAGTLGYFDADGASGLVVVEGQAANAWAGGFSAAHPSAADDAPIVLVNGDQVPPETAEFLSGGGFAVSTTPAPGERVLTCAALDAGCFAARRLLGLDGVEVAFAPEGFSPAVPGHAVDITLSDALPEGTEAVVDGTCLRDPVSDLSAVVLRTDLPPLPCTVTLTLRYPSGVVQRSSVAYGE